MATSQPVATYTAYATLMGIRHELSVTVRDIGNCDENALAGMAAHTIATWARVWLAVMRNDTGIPEYKGEAWPSACQQKEVANLPEFEPHVTVWNKAWSNGDIGITVHSWDNGLNALRAARAMFIGLEKMNEHFARFDIEKFEFLTPPAKPATASKEASKRDIEDVDSFLNDPASHGVDIPLVEAGDLPFRRFKQLAEGIIQVQEFKQGGGGDKYVKSAILATLPFNKETPQYDENSLVYYPITGEISIKEGNYGKQAIIPTARGRVYIDMEYNGQEKPEWATLSADLHKEYDRLVNDDNAKLFAPNCVLVLKCSAITTNKKGIQVQYKNYARIYQPLK